MAKKYLRIKSKEDGKEVHKVYISNPSQRKVEKVMMGVLINMGEDFYIDDSDFDDVK